MQYLFKDRLHLVWLSLIVVTLVSWFLSNSDAAQLEAGLAVSVGVIVFAVIKAAFVLRTFMEIGHASPWLRMLSNVWIVGLPIAVAIGLMI